MKLSRRFNRIFAGLEFHPIKHTINWDIPYPVYEAQGYWNVPSASAPWYGTCWWPEHCDVAPWVGLANSAGGNEPSCSNGGCIVQTGSDSSVQCSFGTCYPEYWVWYEFLPAGSAMFTQVTVNQGDRIYADAYSQRKYDGDTLAYTVYIRDQTSGQACTAPRSCVVASDYASNSRKLDPSVVVYSTTPEEAGYRGCNSALCQTILFPYIRIGQA